MYKLVLICVFFITTGSDSYAQARPQNSQENIYEYYIRIAGIHSRENVLQLQNQVIKKPGIRFFMANRYPVRYFLLRSDHVISQRDFQTMLGNPHFSVEFYGEGSKGKEQAILIYNKTKAR